MTDKDKKEIKGYMKKLSDDFGKQIGVYVEDINDRFKALGEGTNSTNEQLDRMEKTLDSHSGQIARLTMDMTTVKLGIKEIQTELKNKADKSEIIKIDARVSTLEIV